MWNGQHYIPPTSESFPEFICCWIEAVLDCFIPHPSSFKCGSKSFVADDVLSFQYDSNGVQSGSPTEGLKISLWTITIFYCFSNKNRFYLRLESIHFDLCLNIDRSIVQNWAHPCIKHLQNQFAKKKFDDMSICFHTFSQHVVRYLRIVQILRSNVTKWNK